MHWIVEGEKISCYYAEVLNYVPYKKYIQYTKYLYYFTIRLLSIISFSWRNPQGWEWWITKWWGFQKYHGNEHFYREYIMIRISLALPRGKIHPGGCTLEVKIEISRLRPSLLFKTLYKNSFLVLVLIFDYTRKLVVT